MYCKYLYCIKIKLNCRIKLNGFYWMLTALIILCQCMALFKGRLYERHSIVESTQLANLSRLNLKTIAWNPKRHSTRLESTQNLSGQFLRSNLHSMAKELSLLLLLSNNSRRKRQIKQRTHPLKVQEAIPAVEYNGLEADWRDNIIAIYTDVTDDYIIRPCYE